MANLEKCWPKKDAMIGHIGVVSHHLRSLLGVIIKLTLLCVFVCGLEQNIMMFRLGRLYCTSREFDILATLKKCD